MTRVVVTGYASLDHVLMLDGPPAPDRTTTILSRPAGAWPRLGGSPAYVATALVAGGCPDVAAVSWVGDDPGGHAYREGLLGRGVDPSGVVAVPGARTPAAVLSYEPGGACYCFYDPGMAPVSALSDGQAALLQDADWLCLTIGPKAVTDAVLDRIRPTARLAWAVKHDPRALDDAQAARIAARADLICHSRGEAAFVRGALATAGRLRPGCLLVETRGPEGAFLRNGASETLVPAEPLARVADPTGAGDTLVGGLLAALIAGEPPRAAVARGIAAAAALLLGRQSESRPDEP